MDGPSQTPASPPEPESQPASRRDRNKAENRATLLRAARATFAEMGFGAASVRDIVRRTDLASGTFYNYFKDKAEIFEAVVGELTAVLVERHRDRRARASDARSFLRESFSVYFHFLADDRELLELARRNMSAVRTLLDTPQVQTLRRQLFDDVKNAQARGVLPKIDPVYFTASIAGVAFEMSVAMIARDPVDPDAAAEFATRLILGGLEGAAR